MAEPNSSTARPFDWILLAFGVVMAGGGFSLRWCSWGLGARRVISPNWLGLATVLIFFAAGLLVPVRAWLRVPDKQANLPDDTPAVAVAIQWLAALTIITGLASIGAWIAFGPGPRQLSISLPVWGSLAEMIDRAAFGFGAIITWLMAVLMAYAGAKKVLRKKR
jgi:hypothetical protein